MWPEHAAIVEAWCEVASQWRTSSIGGGFEAARPLWIGLDYGGVRAALDALEITVTPTLWRGLTIMEQAARRALNGD